MIRFALARNLPVSVAKVLATSGLFVSAAYAAEPTQQELLDEVRALRAKVDRLEQSRAKHENRLSEKEVDAVIENVIRDADGRSQLLDAGGFTAGYNKGKFIVRSDDGNFTLNPNFQFQLRYVANYRQEDAAGNVDGDATTESGLEISRMKMVFEGNVFGPDTRYKFQWNANTNSGNLALEEAYLVHKLNFAPDFWIKGGQYKDVTFHEEATSSRRQLAADRSLANESLAGGQTDYLQGVGLVWDDGADGLPLRGEVGYTDGPNSDNTHFVDGGGSAAFDVAAPGFGIYGRVEHLVFGDWKHYEDFTTMGNVQDTLVIGAGAFYTQAGGNDLIFHTFDAQYEYNLLGLYAAFYGVYTDNSASGTNYDFGTVLQAGYMLDKKWEPFARYSLVSLESEAAGADADNYHELTAGVNYYLRGHAAKFTLDLTWLPNGAPSNQPQIDVLDPDGDNNQFVLRGQFQLLL